MRISMVGRVKKVLIDENSNGGQGKKGMDRVKMVWMNGNCNSGQSKKVMDR